MKASNKSILTPPNRAERNTKPNQCLGRQPEYMHASRLIGWLNACIYTSSATFHPKGSAHKSTVYLARLVHNLWARILNYLLSGSFVVIPFHEIPFEVEEVIDGR